MARAVPVQVRFAAIKTVWFPSSLFFVQMILSGKICSLDEEFGARLFVNCGNLAFLKLSVFPSFPKVHLDELLTLRILVLDELEDFLMFCVGDGHLFL